MASCVQLSRLGFEKPTFPLSSRKRFRRLGMTHWVSSFETLSYRVDPQRSLTLSFVGAHHWHLHVWGPEPFMTEIEDLTFEEALVHARSLVANYFRHMNPTVKVPSFLPWCAAVAVRKLIAD